MPEVGTIEWSREEVDSFEGSRDEERAIEDYKEDCAGADEDKTTEDTKDYAGVEEDDDDKKTEDNEGKTHKKKHPLGQHKDHPQEDEDHSH